MADRHSQASSKLPDGCCAGCGRLLPPPHLLSWRLRGTGICPRCADRRVASDQIEVPGVKGWIRRSFDIERTWLRTIRS